MVFTAISLPADRPAGTTFEHNAYGTLVGGATLQGVFDATHTPTQYITQNINSGLNFFGIDFGVGASYTITRIRFIFASTAFTDKDDVLFNIRTKATGGSYVSRRNIRLYRYASPHTEHVDYYHLNLTNVEGLRFYNDDIYSRQRVRGVILYIGDFEYEEDREGETLGSPLYLPGDGTLASGTVWNSANPPSNVLDSDPNNYYEIPYAQRLNAPSVTIELPDPTLVNYIAYHAGNTGGSSRFSTFILSVSEDGVHFSSVNTPPVNLAVWDNTPATPPNWHGRYYYMGIDLRSILLESYKFFRFSFIGAISAGTVSYRIGYLGLFRLGRWSLGICRPDGRYISHSSTYPMLIADREPLECSGSIGAVTSSEEGEGLYLNRIYREPLEAEGFCGAIGGEYDWEEEDFIIEREISAQAFISPFADLPMLARDMNGLAGFGRQGNGAITIRHSVEGSTGEFALMDDATRSRYEMEGHCGTRAEMTRQLSMAGFAQPGNNSRATLFREPFTMSALAGAIAGGTRTVEVSATALQHLFASLASSLPARTALATAVVNGMAWGDCTLHSRQMDAEAVVSLFSHGSQTVPARWAEGQAMTGGLTSADLTLPTYTVEAQGVVDALATAHFLRTNYRMTGKTRGSRFDTYLLKYEAPL